MKIAVAIVKPEKTRWNFLDKKHINNKKGKL
jgi:hypothetical protein